MSTIISASESDKVSEAYTINGGNHKKKAGSEMTLSCPSDD
jgi:hypothetical protein